MKPSRGIFDIGLEHSQQMFADLNRHAIRLSSIAGSSTTTATKKLKLAKLVIFIRTFRDIVEMEKSSLAKRSRKLFTLSAFYTACADLVQDLASGDLVEDAILARKYWEAVAQHFPSWGQVKEGRMPAGKRSQQRRLHSFTWKLPRRHWVRPAMHY